MSPSQVALKPVNPQNGENTKTRREKKRENWSAKPGTLTIDLSCPFVPSDSACTLFEIGLGIWLEQETKSGRVIALDEAHKFMTGSIEAEGLTDRLLEVVSPQRHGGKTIMADTHTNVGQTGWLDLCT